MLLRPSTSSSNKEGFAVKVELKITGTRHIVQYNQFQPDKTEGYTVADVNAELEEDAVVGFLRALANSLEGDKRCGGCDG